MNATAAVWSGTGFTVTDVALPDLSEQELLVAVELTTICGSDVHTIGGDRETPVPTILGHEAVGRVVAAGPGAEAAPGDRVVWTVGTACGRCRRCARGVPQKCVNVRKYGHESLTATWTLNGTFATHVHLIAGTTVVRVPDGLPAALLAPAGCATATVTCAARRVDLAATDAVVVLGCGMLGLTTVAYARDCGVTSITVCDPDSRRRRWATGLGASAACAPEDLARFVDRSGADVVFEMTGRSSSVAAALDIVDVDGRIALVGSVSPGPKVPIDPNLLVRSLTRIIGSHNYAPVDLEEAVAFLARTPHREQLAALVSDPMPLSAIAEATIDAAAGAYPRIAIEPETRQWPQSAVVQR